MGSRQLVLVSMLVYALACALPALDVSQNASPTIALGIHCLTAYWAVLNFPFPLLFFWVVNPWLWALWVRAWIGEPTSDARWGVVGLAIVSAAGLAHGFDFGLLIGTWLWVVSAAIGAYAGRQQHLASVATEVNA
jgi:hypothetical protein